MNVDYLITVLRDLKKTKNTFNENTFIKYKSYINPKSDRLYVILPGWKCSFKDMKILRKRILNKGFSFIDYQFHEKILSSDYKKTIKYFTEIKNKVNSDIKDTLKKSNIKKVSIIGISLGTSNALMIANNNKIINQVILICPGNSVAEPLWTGVATKKIKEEFIKNHISLKKLKEYWKKLALENNINSLKNKEIFIYSSKTDKVIEYKYCEKLIKQMRSKGLKPIIKTNFILGHYGTLFKVDYSVDFIN